MQQVKRHPDPAPSRLAYRAQRLMLSPLLRAVLRVGLPFGIACGGALVYLSDDARRDAIVQSLAELRQGIETRPEFMVRLLAVEGASAALEADIRARLSATLPASSFDIDVARLRARIAALPAVSDADLRIRRGGTMVVRVKERLPAAIWRSRDGVRLVDAQGVVLGDARARPGPPGLPVIAGMGADRDVPGALAILQAAAPLGNRVLGLVRVGERRWDVVLDRDQRILLPEGKPVRALERVLVMSDVNDLLERDVAVVDMRLPERPTVRMTPPALAAWWQLRRMSGGAENG